MILFALSRIGRFISDDWWMKLYMTLLYYQISSIAVSCGTFLKQCIEGWKSQQKSFASCSKWLCIITPWVVIKNQVILYLCIQNQNNSYWNVQMQNWYKPVLLGICLLIMAPIFSPLAPNCSSYPDGGMFKVTTPGVRQWCASCARCHLHTSIDMIHCDYA